MEERKKAATEPLEKVEEEATRNFVGSKEAKNTFWVGREKK